MTDPSTHKQGCGCDVCVRRRERLANNPRERELAATRAEHDQHAPAPAPRDETPPAEEPGQTVIVEHHEHHHAHDRHVTERHRHRHGEKPSRRRDRRHARKHHRHHSITRTIVTGLVLLWLLNSFYPGKDVPFVPGIACTSPGTVVPASSTTDPAGIHLPGPGLLPRPLPGPKVGEVVPKAAKQTVEQVWAAVRYIGLKVLGGIFHTAGNVVRSMLSHPPSVDDIRSGLTKDAEQVGRIVGWVVGAFGGKSVEELGVFGSPVTNSCVPCPTTGTTNTGAAAAARAALAAGWTGQDAVTAVAVAAAESGFNPKAANPSSTARGMWQIMLSVHQPKFDGADWADPGANAKVAHQIWQDAGGWSPWTVYTSGAYRSHLTEARAAVAAAAPVAARVAPTLDKGLQPVAQQAETYIRDTYGVTNIGGYATSGHISGSKHYQGLALDVMVPLGPLADKITSYFAGPGYHKWHVDNVIHNQRIYNSGRGWHPYTGTSPHTDHVHIDFTSGAAVTTAATRVCANPAPVVPASTKTGGQVTVGSFNVLGASHRRNGAGRVGNVPTLFDTHGVDVAGLQEFEAPQAAAFTRDTAGEWSMWHPPGDTRNAIVWRTSMFDRVDQGTVAVPYFNRDVEMPWVELRDAEGRPSVYLNVHNPASGIRGMGDKSARRAEAVRRELAAITRLSVRGPVVWTGDMNARTEFARQVAGSGVVEPAGKVGGIDWVLSTPGVTWDGWTTVRDRTVRATTDHPLVYATATHH